MAANNRTLPVSVRALPVPHVLRRWLPLALVLLLALAVRLPYAPDPAYRGDLVHFARWMNFMEHDGLLQFYQPELRMGTWDRPYPPLPTYAFRLMSQLYGGAPAPATALDDPAFVVLLKALPIAAELGLIAVVGVWLTRQRSRLRWLIPGALALYPGLITTSAWWGQYDSVFTVFVVLALVALNRDKPLAAWVWFAVALLVKQPAAAVGPLLLVVSFRRYGWRRTALGMALCVGLYAGASLPFVAGSGLQNALSPYLKASDAFPYLTNNAYNSWYAAAALVKGAPVGFAEAPFRDSLPLLGSLSAKTVGFGLLGVYTLLLCVVFWRQAHERREFVWAAALFTGFFMLPTQVHERYLYPAAIFAVVGIAQDRRLLWVAFGMMLTFSYNVLAILVPQRWPGADLAPQWFALPAAFANVVLFALLTRATLFVESSAPAEAASQRVTTQTLPAIPQAGR